MIRKLFFFVLFFVLTTYSFATVLDSIYVKIRLDEKKNVLHITESYFLSPKTQMPTWHRVVFHEKIAGNPLLYQRLENILLKDNQAKEYPLEVYSYGRERTYLDYQGEDLKGATHLSYDILNPLDNSNKLAFNLLFYDFSVATKTATIDFELPPDYSFNKTSWDYFYYDGQDKEGDFGYGDDLEMEQLGDNTYRVTINVDEGHTALFNPGIEGEFEFQEAIFSEAPYTFEEEWEEQGGFLLWVLLWGITIAIIARFLPANSYPYLIKIYGIVLLLLTITSGLPLYIFMYKFDGLGHNFWMEFGSQMVLVSTFFLVAHSINKNLNLKNSKAYYSVLSFPFLIFALVGPAFVNPTMYCLIPLAFAPLIFWFQSKNANYLGAYYYRLIEKVETAGKLSFQELSEQSQLPIQRILEIVSTIPHHPIHIDYEQKEFIHTGTIALLNKHQLCNNCGAATEIKNEDLVQCNYCQTAYRESREKKVTKPVPDLVYASYQIVSNIAALFFIFCILMLVVMLVDTISSGFENVEINLVVIAVIFVVFGGLGALVQSMAENLKTGESALGKWFLLLVSFFITPAYILYKFYTDKRIQLHFDKEATEQINQLTKDKKTITIKELAAELSISESNALEIADYLCGNNRIDAVFDIQNNRLVHRSLWKKLANQNSCKDCGGLMHLKDKTAECMYCGSSKGIK